MSERQTGFMKDASLAAGLLFGLLGFAGNWLKVPLFSNMDFLFGSFFVMTAVIRYGAGTGVIASLIAGSCTVLLWKHPWAMITFTAETAFVGWRILQRGRSSLLMSDIMFWCCCGIPMTWFLYYVAGGETAAFTLLIAAAHLVNGVFNALFASIFQLLSRKSGKDQLPELPTLNQIVFTLMVSLVLVPALIHIIGDIRHSLRDRAEALSQDTAGICAVSTEVVALWLNDHHKAVRTLAKQVGDPDRAPQKEMQRTVEAIRASTPAFTRMAILNGDAVTVAYSPLTDDFGQSTVGIDYSDRPYLKNLGQGRGSYLGDVFPARVGKPTPIVPMLAALAPNGEDRGVAVGIIDVEDIKKHLKGVVASRAVSITILDRLDQVVASTRDDLPVMTRFRRETGGTVAQAGNGVTLWTPSSESGTTVLGRWAKSHYVKEATLSPETPWKIRVEASYAPVLQALQSEATFALSMLALLILIIVPLSQALSRRLTADLATLGKETRRLPTLVRGGRDVTLPNSAIQEVAGLIANFRETSAALGLQYQSLDNLNNELEKRVREAETRFKTMFENHTAAMLLVDPESGIIVDANRRASSFYGYTLERLRGMALSEISCLPPEELEALEERVVAGVENAYLAPHRLAGGEMRTVEVYATAITVGPERVVFSIILDVTERKLAEKVMEDYRDKLEQQVLVRTASLLRSNEQLEREIEERKRTEQQLRAHQQKLSDLAVELSLAEERERKRITGELHDQVGRRLLFGKTKLEALANRLPIGLPVRDVTEITELLEQALQDIGSLTVRMRPPLLAAAGLSSGIQWLGEELRKDFGLQLDFHDDHQPKPLKQEAGSVVFQAVRELLLNVVKHAGAKKASVSLTREADSIVITVADDGIGIGNTGKEIELNGECGFGISLVRQRIACLGGRLTLESPAGKGTRIAMTVPLA